MKKIISIVLVVVWLIFIYYMSSFNSYLSGRQSGVIVNYVADVFNISNKYILGIIVRKTAHYFLYFVLGLLTCNMFNSFNNKKIFNMICFCIFCAIFDEIHQLFVNGRSGTVIDVFIDMLGSISSIYLCKLFHIFKYE